MVLVEFFVHKNKSRAETTQNNEKRISYFSLRFPTRIHFWVSKMQIPKSLHPNVQDHIGDGLWPRVRSCVYVHCVKDVDFWLFTFFSISFTQIKLAKVHNPKTYLEKAIFDILSNSKRKRIFRL